MKTGTLKELNVKPGDVVGYRVRITYTMKMRNKEMWAWNEMGHWGFRVAKSRETYTIISRATPDLPYGHVTLSDGRRVDLTKNRVRCDLMDPEELQVMKDHGGPYEKWGLGEWSHCSDPMWITAMTYRVAPKPVVETEPREWLISMDTMHVQSVPSGFKPDGSATSYVHVREVIIDTKTEEL